MQTSLSFVAGALVALLGVAVLSLAWWTSPVRSPAPNDGERVGGTWVIWSPGYRVSFFGIEQLHPIDTYRSDKIVTHLVREGLVERRAIAVPRPASDAELARVHDAAYLASLHRTPDLASALEVPVPDIFPQSVMERRVRHAFRLASGGTVLAAERAVQDGFAVNLGGGFHHARPDMGHGFCIYGDVALAIAKLRDAGFEGKVLIVDTDAHQGDGNHAFFADDSTVFSMSMHQGNIFPHPKLEGDLDLPLPAGMGDAAFMRELSVLERLIDTLAPALVIHVAGSDVLHDDPLAQLGLSVDGLVDRDTYVHRVVRQAGIPLVHTLAGGYGPSAALAQSRSVAAMMRAEAALRTHPSPP